MQGPPRKPLPPTTGLGSVRAKTATGAIQGRIGTGESESGCPSLEMQALRCAGPVVQAVRSGAPFFVGYPYRVETVALVTPPRVDWTMTEVTWRLGPGLSLSCQLLVASTTAVPSLATGVPGVVL